MQSKQNKSETDVGYDTAHFRWLEDSSAIAADSVKNLLRGLGVSELPKNLTTHFLEKFFIYPIMLHPLRHQVKQNCKKIQKVKIFIKNGEKRR